MPVMIQMERSRTAEYGMTALAVGTVLIMLVLVGIGLYSALLG